MKYLNSTARVFPYLRGLGTVAPIGMLLAITEGEQALLDEIQAGDEQTGNANEKRLAKLNAIGLKSDEDRADELVDVHDDDTTSKFVPGQIDDDGNPVVDEAAAAEAAAAAEEKAAAEARAAAEAAAAAEAPPAKRKLKINGVEKEVTEDELLELAQKSAAADDTFQKAAKLRAEAESLAAPKPPVKDVSADDSAELLALARALQVGTDEEAVAALRKLKAPAPPPAVSADEVYRAIDAKLAFNDAIRTFETEYADLVKDSRLDRMIMDKDNEMVKAGDKRPFMVRYREIGDEVRAWVKSIAGPTAAAPPADPLLEKAARKAAAPAVPIPAGGKAPPTQSEDEPEPSVQEILAQMSKARGGSHRLRG
jgi:hypothetical protein